MSNPIDFYKEIFLQAIPVRIIVPWSMKNYSDEIFVQNLRSISFPDYSNHTCVNDVSQEFVTKFLSAIGSVSAIRTLRVKSNTKPWFEMSEILLETVMSTIKNSTIRQEN